MPLYHYTNKQVLRLGPKAAEFLKQYTTNVPQAPRTAFIDLKGKIVAVADQKLLDANQALIVIGKPFVDRLKKHLKSYLFLTETGLTEESWSVYHDLEGEASCSGDVVIPQKKGQLILSKKEKSATVSESEFRQFRLENNLPIQGVDFDEELLLNVGDEEFVSYDKGCYLGQEIIARVHYKGKPPKRLISDPEKGFYFAPNN